MPPIRKPPHCKTCNKPRKGHKRGACDLTDMSSPTIPHSCVTTPNSAPLERFPILSTESSQILNDILRANSCAARPISIPEVKRAVTGRSGRGTHKSLGAALDCLPAKNEDVKKLDEESLSSPKCSDLGELPDAETKVSLPLTQTQTSTFSLPKPCVVSQRLLLKASNKESILKPLTITMSQQFKLEGFTYDGTHNNSGKFSAPDMASAEMTIQNFLDGMASNPEFPPSTIFSYPIDNMASLEESVKKHGLCMHVLYLSEEKWVPVVIGKDIDTITKLLEDSEKLAQDLRRPVAFQPHVFDLRISHVVVGALGALATWAGLAYT